MQEERECVSSFWGCCEVLPRSFVTCLASLSWCCPHRHSRQDGLSHRHFPQPLRAGGPPPRVLSHSRIHQAPRLQRQLRQFAGGTRPAVAGRAWRPGGGNRGHEHIAATTAARRAAGAAATTQGAGCCFHRGEGGNERKQCNSSRDSSSRERRH